VGREEAAQRTARALAVVMPARWYENMPNAVTEAMAMGRPVLASGLGSLPEQVRDGENGFLLSPERPRDWSEALLRLDRDRDLARRLGQAGRERALEEFSPGRHHEALMDTFERARHAVAGR
jgi:glycosyltransferase involved in cell wall biosynthesis